MSRRKSAIPDALTFEEVWERVGRVPLNRIRISRRRDMAPKRMSSPFKIEKIGCTN